MFAVVATFACSHDRPPVHGTQPAHERERRPPGTETETRIEPRTALHARLATTGADLYLPPWFSLINGQYDLIVHFHGESRWQAANIEHAKLNVAVVTVNIGGLGTEPYSKAFKDPHTFDRLLDDAQVEIANAEPTEHPRLHRLALSAWSAGFSSVSRIMTEAVVPRIDAVLLADGFFTAFTDPKKRTVDTHSLEKFARFAEAAKRDEKLFTLTHTAIPTGPYPSVQECASKLLEMVHEQKTIATNDGPRQMHAIYTVDEGSFHVHGYDGTQAADHVKQLQAMGETTYPYLKARWEKQDANQAPPARSAPRGARTP